MGRGSLLFFLVFFHVEDVRFLVVMGLANLLQDAKNKFATNAVFVTQLYNETYVTHVLYGYRQHPLLRFLFMSAYYDTFLSPRRVRPLDPSPGCRHRWRWGAYPLGWTISSCKTRCVSGLRWRTMRKLASTPSTGAKMWAFEKL